MTAHDQCTHEKTKAARATCRRGGDAKPAAKVKAAAPAVAGTKLKFRPLQTEITLKQSAREARTIQPSCSCGHPGHKGTECMRPGCPCGTRIDAPIHFTTP